MKWIELLFGKSEVEIRDDDSTIIILFTLNQWRQLLNWHLLGLFYRTTSEQRSEECCHCVHPPFFAGGGGGGEPPIYFSKGRLDRTAIFIGGVAGKEGGDFFRDNCNFYIKNKLKSEIFNDKKGL